MSNKLNIIQAVAELKQLSKKGEDWEKGAHLTSNNELYKILGEGLDIYVQTKGNRRFIHALNQEMDSRKIKHNIRTALAVKICKLIFGDCGNRLYGYATAISLAAKERIDGMGLPDWILAKNGIENIRRTKAKKPVKSATALEQDARSLLHGRKPLFKFTSKIEGLTPNAEAEHSFSVALVREGSDGKPELVFSINDKSVVRKVLLAAGKDIGELEQEKSATTDRKTQSSSVRDAISDAVAVQKSEEA